MKFALFYEIPVPAPGRPTASSSPTRTRSSRPSPATVRLARLLDRRAPLPAGVLALLEPRGALRRDRGADRQHTARLRRAPDAQAVQPPRAHRGVGRRPRPDLEGPGRPRAPVARPPGPSSRASASTPPRAARCGRRRSSTSSGAGPTRSTSSRASTGRCPSAGSCPSRCRSRTRRCGAPRRSDEGHAPGRSTSASGLCSFAVGLPPSEVKRKIDIYREAVAECTEPIGAFVNNQAATFTMAICATDREKAIADARESFEWYPKTGARQIAHADRLDGRAHEVARHLRLRRPT